MKRKRFSEEQIIKILKAHEAGVPLAELAREHGFAEGTIYTWKAKYGGMEVAEAKRLKELEAENKKLKKLLADKYPRYGCPLLHGMLKREGLVVNHKRTYRLYTEEGLQVRTKKRKKLVRPRIPMALPSKPGERWSLDFVSDQLASGRRFRVLNVVDDFTRECVGQLVDTSISGARLARFLSELGRPLPRTIVMDNGPELTSKAMFFWSQDNAVKLHFIQPGKPTQNAFVESFNGRFREGCLNQHWFKTLTHARSVIDAWRTHYNEERPHSSLDYLPPAVFARKVA